MTVNCYPVAGKAKSMLICSAFADGCGGRVITDGVRRPGPAMFYGVRESNEDVWNAVRADGDDWYYADNSYFDCARGAYFRITKNAMQCSGRGTSDGARFRALGAEIRPWRTQGTHVVVCPQSDHFMRLSGYAGDWTTRTISALASVTERPVVLSLWSAAKTALAANLRRLLAQAHALVVYSSAAAVTALMSGVPIVSTGDSASSPLSGAIEDVDRPKTPTGRQTWASVLADNQWTLDEMRSGTAWRALGG